MPSITSGPVQRPRNFAELFDRLSTRPSPAVVFYGSDGGRVELSGRVLENWVAKTANLLVDDLGLMPQDLVLVDPATHWRSAAVIAAAWRLGATVELACGTSGSSRTSDTAEVNLAVVQDTDPSGNGTPAADRVPEVLGEASAEELMVLAYPALAMSTPATRLPTGAIDFCAEVRAHGDHWSHASAPAPQDLALIDRDQRSTYAGLFDDAAARADDLGDAVDPDAPPVTAVHLDIEAWSGESLRRMVGAWIAGVTVVMTDPRGGTVDVERILAEEKVALTWC